MEVSWIATAQASITSARISCQLHYDKVCPEVILRMISELSKSLAKPACLTYCVDSYSDVCQQHCTHSHEFAEFVCTAVADVEEEYFMHGFTGLNLKWTSYQGRVPNSLKRHR